MARYSYTTRDGQRVEVHGAAAYDRMNAAFKASKGYQLFVSSGVRTTAEQQYFWNGYIKGLPGFNLAARPGTSNHEENGPVGPRALDIRDSGPNAGVTTRGTDRDRWMEQNAGTFGFKNAGYSFSKVEAWHKEYQGSLAGSVAAPSQGGPGFSQTVKDRQAWLNTSRSAGLVEDGLEGPTTVAAYRAYQTFLRAWGYTGDIDGAWGPGTQAAHARYYESRQNGGRLAEDGNWGVETAKKLQTVLGVAADGDFGPNSWKALQTALGVNSDGIPGAQTYTALQAAVGAAQDGQMGPATVKKLQAYLNGGGNFKTVTAPPAPAAPARLAEDGEMGTATIKALQRALGVQDDGQMGPATVKALQTALGVAVDGAWGSGTTKAVQILVGSTADGQIGPNTVKALQAFLNAGKKFTKVSVPAADPSAPVVAPAKARTPVLPFASKGWDSPLGREKRAAGSVIDALAVHHAASIADQTAYFLSSTAGAVPTWFVDKNGAVQEFTRPGLRPVTTGGQNNHTVSIETQNTTGAPTWEISDASVETIAQIAAFLHSYNGKELDGIPVRFELDRKHILGHREFPGQSTECPGPYLLPKLDAIVARARVIYAQKYTAAPTGPGTPSEDMVSVPKSWLQELAAKAKGYLGK